MKLKIEMSMADLITKVALDRGDVELDSSSTNASNPRNTSANHNWASRFLTGSLIPKARFTRHRSSSAILPTAEPRSPTINVKTDISITARNVSRCEASHAKERGIAAPRGLCGDGDCDEQPLKGAQSLYTDPEPSVSGKAF